MPQEGSILVFAGDECLAPVLFFISNLSQMSFYMLCFSFEGMSKYLFSS